MTHTGLGTTGLAITTRTGLATTGPAKTTRMGPGLGTTGLAITTRTGLATTGPAKTTRMGPVTMITRTGLGVGMKDMIAMVRKDPTLLVDVFVKGILEGEIISEA